MKLIGTSISVLLISLTCGCVSTKSQVDRGYSNVTDNISDNFGRAQKHNTSLQSGSVYSPYSSNVQIKLPGRVE